MKIYESKNGVLATCFCSLLIGLIGVYFIIKNQSGVGYFTALIGILCIFMCLKKYFSKNYIEILDDKIIIYKKKKFFEIYYKDLKEILLRTIDEKRNLKAIYITFKKVPKEAENFLRIINDENTILAAEYAKSKYEICNILKQKLEDFKNINPKKD